MSKSNPKKYRLPLSRIFPVKHPRKGESTDFYQQIQNALAYQQGHTENGNLKQKLHTIRENVEYWEKRIDKINAGNAILEVYEWTGKPYRSAPKTLFSFDQHSGIGYQKAFIRTSTVGGILIPERNISVNSHIVAKNDGLSLQDFQDWFKKSDPTKAKIIIHFTDFRY